MKANLTKKKVRVRGKGGKTYMRSMSVRTQGSSPMTAAQFAKKHGAHVLARSVGVGAASYGGALAGGIAGAHIGKQFSGSHPIQRHAAMHGGAEIGANFGTLVAMQHGMNAAYKRNARGRQIITDAQRLSTGGKLALIAANTIGIAGTHHLLERAGTHIAEHGVSFRRTH